MKAKKIIDLMITNVALLIFLLSWLYVDEGLYKNLLLSGSLGIAIVFLSFAIKKENQQAMLHFTANHSSRISPKITEVVLLSEEDTEIARWELYGKTAMVIGRDVGENDVDINLNYVADAGLIDKEHAVLNYCLNNWYIEDLGSKNGISLQKAQDGRRYKLAPDKPCKLDKGDVIYIALTKLLIQ